MSAERPGASGPTGREQDRTWLLDSLDRSPDVIFVTDPDDRLRYVSHAVLGLTGMSPEDLTGKPFLVVVKPSDHGAAQDALEGARRDERERPQILEMAWRSADPRKQLFVEVSLHSLRSGSEVWGCIGVARDMSDRHESLGQRFTHERVAAIVELSVATAHRVNNPLAILSMHLGVVRHAVARGEPVAAEVLEQMGNAVERIAEVTRDLEAMADTSVQKAILGRAMVDLDGWLEVGKSSAEETS